MQVYTIEPPGVVLDGADLGPDFAAPDGAESSGGRLVRALGEGALVLVRDHSGPSGSWHIRAAQPEARWDAMLAAQSIPNALDRILAAERVRARFPHRAPAGWRELARAERAGSGDPWGGPLCDRLGVLDEGAAVEIRRRGRLGGTPSVFVVTCRGGRVVSADPLALAAARRAAVREARPGRAV